MLQNIICVLLALTTTAPAYDGGPGQTQPNTTGEKRHGAIFATPAHTPQSLDDLVRLSDAIVRGTVRAVLPSRSVPTTGPSGNLETDVQVSVEDTYKGSVPGGVILVTQSGGQTADLSLDLAYSKLMQPGEEYFLFLKKDERPIPAPAGPRFAVVGIWSGKIRIDNGIVEVAAAAAPGLRAYHGMPLGQFLTDLKGSVAKLGGGTLPKQ